MREEDFQDTAENAENTLYTGARGNGRGLYNGYAHFTLTVEGVASVIDLMQK